MKNFIEQHSISITVFANETSLIAWASTGIDVQFIDSTTHTVRVKCLSSEVIDVSQKDWTDIIHIPRFYAITGSFHMKAVALRN